jgi:SAM-dependent methyltransferase
VDFSPAAVDWARERAGGGASFVCADVRHLPFGSGIFDRVLDGNCWHCIVEGRTEFLTEARRVLRADGVLTIATMVGPPTGLGLQGYDPETRTTRFGDVAIRYWTTVDEATENLRAAGFRIIRFGVEPAQSQASDVLWADATPSP